MADLITESELVAARPELTGSPDLAALIAAATAAIEGYCGRPLGLTSFVDSIALDFPAELIRLRVGPVAAVTSLTLDGAAIDPADYFLVAAATGEIARGNPRRRGRWPAGWGRIAVAYSAGFDPIPADLKRAAIAWIVDAIDAPGRISSEKIGDYQYSTATGPGDSGSVRPFVAGILDRYRRTFATSGD